MTALDLDGVVLRQIGDGAAIEEPHGAASDEEAGSIEHPHAFSRTAKFAAGVLVVLASAIFAAGWVLAGVAPSIPLLIGSRVAQGIGAVGLFAIGAVLLRRKVTMNRRSAAPTPFSVRESAPAREPFFVPNTVLVRQIVFVRREDTGEPVADAVLTLTEPDGRQVARAEPDADGEYRFEDLEPGDYLLIASKPGLHPYAKLVAIDGAGEPVIIELTEETWLSGVVRSTGRGPLEGATVMLTDPAGDVAATTRTLSDGSYRLGGALLPGTYTMTVTAKACRPSAMVVQLPEGGNAEQDVEVIGGAYLAGAVAVPTFRIELLDARGQVVATTLTDSDGRYRFAEIAEGDYSLRVTAPPSAEHRVSVTAGRLHQLDLTLDS